MSRMHEEVAAYVEKQNQNKCKVVSAKPEHTFEDLGVKVNVWNVKTDVDGAWWVVEGEHVPMNLYPQKAYYFSADEVYSFHMGLMERMYASYDNYEPGNFVRAITLEGEMAPTLFRKLKNVAGLIDIAKETEDFQAIGVQCREIMIELGNTIYSPEMAGDKEQPKDADFKNKAEFFVGFYLSGSDNADYRKCIKEITKATWDYANKITHSRNATFYEVSTCVTLTTSLVGVYENIRQKVYDPLSQYYCKECKSKKLSIIGDESDENGMVSKLILRCNECDAITEVVFERIDDEKVQYVKGKVID